MKLTNHARDAFIRAVMNDVPSIGYEERIHQIVMDAAIKSLPKDVQKVWNNPDTRKYIVLKYTSIKDMTGVFTPNSEVKIPPGTQLELDKLTKLNITQQNERVNLRSKLKNAAYGCNTLKQLREALPDFVKYMPGEYEHVGKVGNRLAVINPINDFKAAGFPKSETKKEKATA